MKRSLILAFIISVTIAGCLATGTIVFVYEIIGFEVTGQQIIPIPINLNLEPDYRDNKDRIKSVEAVTPAGRIINLGGNAVQPEVWISDNAYTTSEQVRQNGKRIFLFPSIPAGDTLKLSWADGQKYSENFDFLEDQVLTDGNFFIYGIASDDFHIEYLVNFVVTLTVGL